ncbi:winged helix-turn-helix domain-containing protein [Halobacteriales archaeon Cl-PHB]
MRDAFDAAPDALGEEAEAAFSLLGDETRIAILRELWAAHDPGPDADPVPFSVLRKRVGAEDSGGFNYHLSKLEGRFVRKTDDGYSLRQAGYQVVRAILAGGFTEETTFGPVDLSIECPFCGGTVEATYNDEVLFIQCTECPGMAGGDNYYAGTITELPFPPAGLANRSPDEVARAYLTWTYSRNRSMAAEVCPECAGPMGTETIVCEAHDSSDDFCQQCDSRYACWTRATCEHCKFTASAPTYYLLIEQPAVQHFFAQRGVNFAAGLTWENWPAVADVTERVASVDPLELHVTFSADGDELTVALDDDLEVVEVGETAA